MLERLVKHHLELSKKRYDMLQKETQEKEKLQHAYQQQYERARKEQLSRTIHKTKKKMTKKTPAKKTPTRKTNNHKKKQPQTSQKPTGLRLGGILHRINQVNLEKTPTKTQKMTML